MCVSVSVHLCMHTCVFVDGRDAHLSLVIIGVVTLAFVSCSRLAVIFIDTSVSSLCLQTFVVMSCVFRVRACSMD